MHGNCRRPAHQAVAILCSLKPAKAPFFPWISLLSAVAGLINLRDNHWPGLAAANDWHFLKQLPPKLACQSPTGKTTWVHRQVDAFARIRSIADNVGDPVGAEVCRKQRCPAPV